MKKRLVQILAVIMILTTLVGCTQKAAPAPAPAPAAPATPAPAPQKKKVALLTDEAGTQVFILSMIDGLKEGAKTHGFEAIVAESKDAAAYEDNARALIKEGVDLLIGGGWQAGEAINKMAKEFPDATKYALIDSQVEAPNVKCISYREQEGAYLIGMIAAMVADENENTFGMVHVNQGAGSWKWRYGFMEGVKTKYPNAKFIANYVGNYNDPAKAKEFALQQFAQGASFINAAAAGGDSGVFEAALEKKFYTSGQDVDLTSPDNKYVVSSQIKDTKATMLALLDVYFSDKKWTGDDEVWGVKEGTIGAVHVTHQSPNPISDRLSKEEIATLKQVADDIKSGKINLTNMPKEEDYFKTNKQ